MLLRVSKHVDYVHVHDAVRQISSRLAPTRKRPKICTGSKIGCVKDGFIVSLVYGRLYKAPSALDRLSTAQHFPPSPPSETP